MHVILVVSYLLNIIAAEKLELVALIFRHGDRSAITKIPNDIYDESSWPQGWGQLSTIGMHNHLNNGKFFRDRYLDPNKRTHLGIDTSYKRDQVYVQSTNKDRTMMSAMSMLAGLFPGPPDNETNMTSPFDIWQPIPVHTVNLSLEAMLDGFPSSQCPYFKDEIIKRFGNDDGFTDFVNNSKNTTKNIMEVTGLEDTDDPFQRISDIAHVNDALFCEMSHNFTIKKEYTDAKLYELTTPYANWTWRSYNEIMDDKLRSICGGVLLRELKEIVRNRINNTDSKRLHLYSGHDTTLASILTAFGVYDSNQTPYATVLVLELWREDDGEYYVTFHKHHKSDKQFDYVLPGCDKKTKRCTIEKYLAVNEHLERTREQFYQTCYHSNDPVPHVSKKTLFIALCGVALAFLISITIFIIHLYCKQRKMQRFERFDPLLNSEDETLS